MTEIRICNENRSIPIQLTVKLEAQSICLQICYYNPKRISKLYTHPSCFKSSSRWSKSRVIVSSWVSPPMPWVSSLMSSSN